MQHMFIVAYYIIYILKNTFYFSSWKFLGIKFMILAQA